MAINDWMVLHRLVVYGIIGVLFLAFLVRIYYVDRGTCGGEGGNMSELFSSYIYFFIGSQIHGMSSQPKLKISDGDY